MRAREREMKTGDICIFPPLEILLWLSLTLLLLQHSSSQMLNCCRDIYWIVVRAGNIKTFKCWFSENSTTVPSQIIKLKALSQNIKTETACRFLNSDSLTCFLLPLFSFISHFTVGFAEQYRTFRNEISLFFILPIPWNCEPPFFEIFLFLLFSWLPYEYFHFIFIIKQQKKEILQGNEISSFI